MHRHAHLKPHLIGHRKRRENVVQTLDVTTAKPTIFPNKGEGKIVTWRPAIGNSKLVPRTQTFKVVCNSRKHSITITETGNLILHDHVNAKGELELGDSEVMAWLGDEKQRCCEIEKLWGKVRNPKKYDRYKNDKAADLKKNLPVQMHVHVDFFWGEYNQRACRITEARRQYNHRHDVEQDPRWDKRFTGWASKRFGMSYGQFRGPAKRYWGTRHESDLDLRTWLNRVYLNFGRPIRGWSPVILDASPIQVNKKGTSFVWALVFAKSPAKNSDWGHYPTKWVRGIRRKDNDKHDWKWIGLEDEDTATFGRNS